MDLPIHVAAGMHRVTNIFSGGWMLKLRLYFSISFILSTILFAQSIPYNSIPDSFFSKDKVKILVTDSGLGGLSIAATLLEEIESSGLFRQVDVIFFNAQPHAKSGYNSMETTEEKVAVFNSALIAMKEKVNPDLILIGCNTLSVIYEYTEFAGKAEIPVIGIVNTGVDLIYDRMGKNPGSNVIIFATRTTVEEAKHKQNLIAKGIDSNKIFMIPCHKLAGNIERDSESRLTDSLVTAFVNTALDSVGDNTKNLFVSYNCTHYGYIDNKFRKAFEEKGIDIAEYLNPNPFMVDILFREKYLHRFDEVKTSIKVISQSELTPDKIGSIYYLVEPQSSRTAEALFDYEYIPDFFEWEAYINE